MSSEQYVLDGLLQGGIDGKGVILGRYSRPEITDQYRFARELYAEKKTSGEFKQYKSQFGLQVKVFSVFQSIGIDGIQSLHAVTALLMSLVVVCMFGLVWRDFTGYAALAFAAVFVLSPWVVVFARNLYWVMFTWYIPMLVTMWLAPYISKDTRKFILMLALLLIVYLIRFLCGYEYLTTIFLASSVPLVYHGIREKDRMPKIFARVFLNGSVLLVSFALALSLHAWIISEGDDSGFEHIMVTAQKRIASDKPVETAKLACEGDAYCEKKMVESLESNPFSVAKKYFLIENLMPWGNLSLFKLNQQNKERLQAAYQDLRVKNLGGLIVDLGIHGVFNLIFYILGLFIYSPIIFLIFIGYLLFYTKQFKLELKLALLVAVVAPFSWFLLAKGHSFIHYHLNYVLWYLPFIPYGVLALVSRSDSSERS